MTEIVLTSSMRPLPQPRCGDIVVRDGSVDDLPFIDALQKAHRKMVGFMATSWIETRVRNGQVLVATTAAGERIGYVIAQDRYLKRDDVGLVIQLNVAPGEHRKLVGATLLKAVFDRAPYGCRLFSCWCAQDIEANRFWEAMGFIPLAFRTGSERKQRVHIFWQARIRAGDDHTPWWFPAQTQGGSIGEDRIVLPIPLDKHWSDEMPLLLPSRQAALPPADAPKPARAPRAKSKAEATSRVAGPGVRPAAVGGFYFAAPATPPPVAEPVSKPPRARKPKVKNDPKLVAAARELRDRWLEQLDANNPRRACAGKYDVRRAMTDNTKPPLLLPAA